MTYTPAKLRKMRLGRLKDALDYRRLYPLAPVSRGFCRLMKRAAIADSHRLRAAIIAAEAGVLVIDPWTVERPVIQRTQREAA